MHVDWITTAAQLVNFLILVYLLKRFLYGRVLAAMDRRQERITARLGEADQREAEAARAGEELNRRIQELEQHRERRMVELERELHTQRSDMLVELRDEMARTRAHWNDAMQRERERFVSELSGESARLSVELAGRVMADLADAKLEEYATRRFVDALDALDEDRRALIRAAEGPLVVRTGLSLDPALRASIEATLSRVLQMEGPFQFARDPRLICGLELVAGHARVGWNVAGHLKGLETRIQEVLARHLQPVSATGPGAGGGHE